LTTGRPPFRGTTVSDLLGRHISEKPSPLTVYNEDLTEDFSAFVLRLLAKKKTDRPDNFHEVLIELRKIRQIFKSFSEQDSDGI
jgi:serine/threonine protein kinase